MSSEASKESLSQPGKNVNSGKLAEISASVERARARITVLLDRSLTPGAKVLYVLLDDYARLKGECWPHQQTLGEQLGLSVDQIHRQLRELECAGHISRKRRAHGTRYWLEWFNRVPCGVMTPHVCGVTPDADIITETTEGKATTTACVFAAGSRSPRRKQS